MLNAAVEFVEGNVYGYATLVGIFLVSVVLLVWEYRAYSAEGEAARTQLRALELQESRVAALRREFSERRLGEMRADLTEANSRIFRDYSELGQWLTTQSDLARTLGLSFSYSVGTTHDLAVQKTSEVPISFSIAPVQASVSNAYRSSLELLREIVDAKWFVEVTGISITGDRSTITETSADIRVWVHNDSVTHEPAE